MILLARCLVVAVFFTLGITFVVILGWFKPFEVPDRFAGEPSPRKITKRDFVLYRCPRIASPKEPCEEVGRKRTGTDTLETRKTNYPAISAASRRCKKIQGLGGNAILHKV